MVPNGFGVTLALALAFAITGCGGGAARPSASATTGAPATASTSASDAPTATAVPTLPTTYPPMSVLVHCDTFTITATAAPRYEVELSSSQSFDDVSVKTLDSFEHSLTSPYDRSAFPGGIWVRWQGAHDIVAFGKLPTNCEVPPEPTRAPLDEAALEAICDGTPTSRADAYAGAVHPVVVLNQTPAGFYSLYKDLPYAINAKWYDGAWPGEIQLVACVDNATLVKVGSCGTYVRQSDGAKGQMIRYKRSSLVRVLEAKTGKAVASKAFFGPIPACAKTLNGVDNPGEKPPWVISGPETTDPPIDVWVTQLSTRAAP